MARRRPLPAGPLDVTIDDIGDADMGVGELLVGDRSKRILVKGTLPGETVRVFARGRRRKALVGRLDRIIEPSPQRVVPICAGFYDCGGCSWQHLSVEDQLARKKQQVEELLAANLVEPQRWHAPVHGPSSGYRNKARLGVRWVPCKGGALVGFREPGSNKIAQVELCVVLTASLARLLPPLRKLIARLSNPRSVPQIEVAAGDNACAVVVRHLEPLTDADLSLWRAFGTDYETTVLLQSGGPDSVCALDHDFDDSVLLDYQADGLKFCFAPTQFTQVNPAINAALIAALVDRLHLNSEMEVLDLFCGLGNLSLPLARRARSVVGYEGDDALVARARHNAYQNGINNAAFETADLYARPVQNAEFDRRMARCDALVLDPPRSGAGELVGAITRNGPQHIAYISCNPTTLASDLGTLCEAAYQLSSIGLFDMFPHTSHVETMAILRRVGSDDG